MKLIVPFAISTQLQGTIEEAIQDAILQLGYQPHRFDFGKPFVVTRYSSWAPFAICDASLAPQQVATFFSAIERTFDNVARISKTGDEIALFLSANQLALMPFAPVKSVHLGREIVRQMCIRIDEHSWSVSQFCGIAGYSLSTLERRCRDSFGTTPNYLMKQLRFSIAHDLLHNKHLSLSEVCWIINYESVSSFSREFKRLFGYSPSIAQRMLRETPEATRFLRTATFDGLG